MGDRSVHITAGFEIIREGSRLLLRRTLKSYAFYFVAFAAVFLASVGMFVLLLSYPRSAALRTYLQQAKIGWVISLIVQTKFLLLGLLFFPLVAYVCLMLVRMMLTDGRKPDLFDLEEDRFFSGFKEFERPLSEIAAVEVVHYLYSPGNPPYEVILPFKGEGGQPYLIRTYKDRGEAERLAKELAEFIGVEVVTREREQRAGDDVSGG